MRFDSSLIDKLSAATPRKHILKWLLMTFVYATIIIVNDYWDMIPALGLPERLMALIRIAGVYVYIMLTTYSFYKTQKNEHDNCDHKISADLEDDAQSDGISAASGAEVSAPGNGADEPQSGASCSGAA